MIRSFDLDNWPPEPVTQGTEQIPLVDVTPKVLQLRTHLVGEIGKAVCPWCETVVAREQAIVSGPIEEPDERYDFRPVFGHQCKQARGVVMLYADQEV